MFVFQKYMFFLILIQKLHFLLKFLFVFSDELMRRWNVNRFEDLLCLFDDNTLKIHFLGFYSALTLCGYRLWSIVINKILSAHGIKHTKRLRYLLDAFLCRYYRLKVPVKQLKNRYLFTFDNVVKYCRFNFTHSLVCARFSYLDKIYPCAF